MRKIAVLITSAGVASAINVIKSLRLQREFELTVVAVDANKLAAGLHLSDYAYVCPPVRMADQYLAFLYEICAKHQVRALFPCYSREISLVARARERFDELSVSTLLPSAEVIELCNNKLETAITVKSLGIPIPEIIPKPEPSDFPLFSRLEEGSGSTGAICINEKYLLDHILQTRERRIFQRFIEGTEFTIDVLCDRNSQVLFCGPRKRTSIKSGQSVMGVTVRSSQLEAHVREICRSLGLVGACNLQFIEKEGQYYFIEINPRYAAGGLMLTVHAGANLPLAALRLMLGLPVDKAELRHRVDTSMTRYWEEIIVEGNCEH